jgi:hypothetical protein
MGVHRKPLDFTGYAHPETARRELERRGFRPPGKDEPTEIYHRGDWRIERLVAGRDLWNCREGQTRWYTGRLEMALHIANQLHDENDPTETARTRSAAAPPADRPRRRQ